MKQIMEKIRKSTATCSDCPLDQNQLGRYTLGDKNAEEKVLNLFQKQSMILLKRLKTSLGESDRRETAKIIRESAQSIGANFVAQEAELTTEIVGASYSREQLRDLRSLENAIQEVNGFIELHLATV